MRAPHDTAACPLRRSDRALPRAAGALLAPWFRATATHLTAGLGIPRPEPCVGELPQQCLVHHRNVRLDGPDRIIQFGLLDHLTLLVMHINDHVNLRGRTGSPAAISAMAITS